MMSSTHHADDDLYSLSMNLFHVLVVASSAEEAISCQIGKTYEKSFLKNVTEIENCFLHVAAVAGDEFAIGNGADMVMNSKCV